MFFWLRQRAAERVNRSESQAPRAQGKSLIGATNSAVQPC